jgi:hypothetical protein
MVGRLLLSGLVLLLLCPLRAQDDGAIKMTPEFPLTFPFVKVGRDITVKFPVMVMPGTILTPGMVLRTIYMPPRPDDSPDLVLAHKGDMAQSFSRSGETPDEQSKMPPEIAHQLEHYRRIVWDTPQNFELAMAQFPTDTMHMIYSPTGSGRDLSDTRFSFFEGLFLGLPDGKVTVLAVEDGSKADQSGFKAGDQILAVGGQPVADLAGFANAYAAARADAKDGNAPSFAMTVVHPGQSAVFELKLAMPPSIKSMLMHGF